MKKALFLLLLFAPSMLHAQTEKVSIRGTAPSYKGEKAELLSVTDHFTEADTLLDEGRVGTSEGEFRFEVEVERVRPAWVRIGEARSKIYLDPGTDYRVEFPKIPEDKVKDPKGGTDVEMTFYELAKDDANNLVIDFNLILQDFFARNHRAIAIKHGNMGGYLRDRGEHEYRTDSLTRARIRQISSVEEKLDSLEAELEERYASIEKEWFRIHVAHALAPIRGMANKDRGIIYERYFSGKPVRYHHEEYMDHFLEFYDKHLITFARRNDSLLDLEEQLVRDPRPGPILEALKHSEYAEEEAIRELLLIDGMFDAYYHKEGFDRDGIMAVLDSIAHNSPRDGAQQITRNLKESLSKRRRGSKAPSFQLMDRDTNIVSLEDLRGAPVYLNFWATWSETSIKEMRIIRKLHEEYGHNIRFVSICTDEKFRDMKGFLEENPDHDWTFLFLGSHEEVEGAYEVASLPAYYFLDREGRFLQVPAPKPGEKARERIHRINKHIDRQKERGKRGRNVWDH